MLGSNLVVGNRRNKLVKQEEVNTLATIRDIEKGLEANLQECMNFLQVLTEDSPKKGPTTCEKENKDVAQPETKIFHDARPTTAPLKSALRTSSTELISHPPRPQSVLSSADNQNDKATQQTRKSKKKRSYSESKATTAESETSCLLPVSPLHVTLDIDIELIVALGDAQVLCSQEDKVIVKDYNYLRQGNSIKSKVESQFDVNFVLDDSFLSRGNRQRKEESQRCMFKILGMPCVERALNGHNSTILAYGQMGSGKTYTTMGDGTLCGRGLVPRIVQELMHRAQEEQKNGVSLSIQVSYLEIYQDKVRDLLVPRKREQSDEEAGVCLNRPLKKDYVRIREHPETGPSVEGLIWKDVTTYSEMENLIKQGASNRPLENMHRLSNRGHTLFTIKLIKMQKNDKWKGTSVCHINLVDLAGSKKMAVGQKPLVERTYESKYINRSLLQLNDVFTNLSSGRSNGKFVSHRSSALRWLLRESVCGSSNTFLVANISPAEQDFQETVHTLRCAAKAKRIHSHDLESKKQTLMKMDDEIRTLQHLMADLTRSSSTSTEAEGRLHFTKESDCRSSSQQRPSSRRSGALNRKE